MAERAKLAAPRLHIKGCYPVSAALAELSHYREQCLRPHQFQDYCPTGLQVEGRPRVARLATGVTAWQRFLDEAIAWRAYAVLVHHGYFWRSEAPQVVGMKRRRLAVLLASEVSLLVYHLPSDANPTCGTNVCLHVGDSKALVRRIGCCTGVAQNYIAAALAGSADLFVSGEVYEQTVHVAQEEGIQCIAAGHHATELCGMQALGDHLAAQFTLEHRFFDTDNPV